MGRYSRGLCGGCNDWAVGMVALSDGAYSAGGLPHYLHQVDGVAVTAHFEVDDATAVSLHAAVSRRLSGYLVPRLVREIAGDSGKRPLTAQGLSSP